MLPKDIAVLVGYLNMKLRDVYPSLEELCDDLGEDREELEARLMAGGYCYDRVQNAFRPRE